MKKVLMIGSLLGIVIAGAALAQTMTEFGAATAGGTIGGAAGKGVSEGVVSIFGKLDQQTKAAAKTAPTSAAPATPSKITAPAASAPAGGPTADAGPPPAPSPAPAPRPRVAAAPAAKPVAKAPAKPAQDFDISPPRPRRVVSRPALDTVPDPPPPAHAEAKVAAAPAPPPPPVVEIAPVLPPPPPPRQASLQDLKELTPGANREDVLRLGAPASRITMFDDGHLLEIYSYSANNTRIGVVRLNDGAVSKVELR